MKKVILACLMLVSTVAFAERDNQGVVFVRAASQSALHTKVQETVALMKSGRYRGANDNCGFSKRRPYAVETSGPKYRFDRHGNMTQYYSAAIKYTCR